MYVNGVDGSTHNILHCCQTYGVDLFEMLSSSTSESAIVEMITAKCTPVLRYFVESCQVSKADLHSLDFTFCRSFMKLFKTSVCRYRPSQRLSKLFC